MSIEEVVATLGSYYDRMHNAVRLAELHRVAAHRRAAQVSAKARREYIERAAYRGVVAPETSVKSASSIAAENDHVVKEHVGNEQWGGRLTTMYGIAHLADTANEYLELQHHIVDQNNQIIALLTNIANTQPSHTSEAEIAHPS